MPLVDAIMATQKVGKGFMEGLAEKGLVEVRVVGSGECFVVPSSRV